MSEKEERVRKREGRGREKEERERDRLTCASAKYCCTSFSHESARCFVSYFDPNAFTMKATMRLRVTTTVRR